MHFSVLELYRFLLKGKVFKDNLETKAPLTYQEFILKKEPTPIADLCYVSMICFLFLFVCFNIGKS